MFANEIRKKRVEALFVIPVGVPALHSDRCSLLLSTAWTGAAHLESGWPGRLNCVLPPDAGRQLTLWL